MGDPLSRSAIDAVLRELAEHQQNFHLREGDAIAVARRVLMHEVAVATATGLVLGGLVGLMLGRWRRP